MRLVFISSVTAITPLRTISVTTASILPRARDLALLLGAMLLGATLLGVMNFASRQAPARPALLREPLSCKASPSCRHSRPSATPGRRRSGWRTGVAGKSGGIAELQLDLPAEQSVPETLRFGEGGG